MRAELARRRIAGRKLAGDLGWSSSRTSRRLTGEIPLNTAELHEIADYLGLPVSALLAEDVAA